MQDLNVLFAIERASARASTREELALAILPEATRALAARTAYVVLPDEHGDFQLLYLASDVPDPVPDVPVYERPSRPNLAISPPSSPLSVRPANRDIRKLRMKLGEGIAGAAITRGEMIIVADVSKDPRRSDRVRQALNKDGDDKGTPCAVVPLFDENEQAFGALAILRRPYDRPFNEDDLDLLRLLTLNASTGFQLEAARETRVVQERLSTIGSLLSGVMHDLKAPMSVISGYVQMMASADDSTARGEYAGLILRQFQHVSAMQKEVLDFARGERTVLIRRVYLGIFFDEIESQLRREIERRGHPIELRMEVHDRGIARFDESKLTRAIHNLARNALEALGETGGRVTISVSRETNGTLVIAVSDTGPGLPKEVEDRLFESFVTAGKPSGTGLGLAIVKKIAQDHQGSIDATSSTAGTRFVLRLPQPLDTAPALRKQPSG
ncbi:MAG: hypothetical protein NVS3B20_08810 [Polyangiales bacterium]